MEKTVMNGKIKKGDNVEIILGKDSGKSGTVEKILSKKGRVLVSGLNLYKRHVKKHGQTEGGVIEIIKSLDISNIALVCPNCKKTTRVGFTLNGKEKARICKKCRKEIK